MKRTAPQPLHRDRANHCFGCGLGNPEGLQLDFQPEEGSRNRSVIARAVIPSRYTGAPRMLHGGIVATLLDEAMAKANSACGLTAVTHRLEVQYRRPVPADQPLQIRGICGARRGRYVYDRAEIRSESGRLLAQASGRFAMLRRDQIQRLGPSPD